MNLRFACQQGCTKCCEVHGFVYITEQDLSRMAEYAGLTKKAFESAYVLRFRHILRLRKPRGSQCYFLKEGGCSVHPVKPTQCRLYPFWPELVENRSNWQAEGKRCPGIGKGELVQIGEACETADEMKTAYPLIYAAPKGRGIDRAPGRKKVQGTGESNR
jgi:Fe-S-cluster containining protein